MKNKKKKSVSVHVVDFLKIVLNDDEQKLF